MKTIKSHHSLNSFVKIEESSTDSFTVHLIAVHEVGMHISHVQNKKSMDPDINLY